MSQTPEQQYSVSTITTESFHITACSPKQAVELFKQGMHGSPAAEEITSVKVFDKDGNELDYD